MTPTAPTIQPKAKIFWTDNEVDTIAQQVALLRLDSNYLNCTLTQLVAAAQQVLPEDRRRPLASYGQVAKDFEARVAAHLKSLMNRPPEVKIPYPSEQARGKERTIALIEEMRRALGINPWCGICGSWELVYEDRATLFETLHEALPLLYELEEEQLRSRGLLDELGLSYDTLRRQRDN